VPTDRQRATTLRLVGPRLCCFLPRGQALFLLSSSCRLHHPLRACATNRLRGDSRSPSSAWDECLENEPPHSSASVRICLAEISGGRREQGGSRTPQTSYRRNKALVLQPRQLNFMPFVRQLNNNYGGPTCVAALFAIPAERQQASLIRDFRLRLQIASSAETIEHSASWAYVFVLPGFQGIKRTQPPS